MPASSKDYALRGIDAFGANVIQDGKAVRIRFSNGAVSKEAWLPTLQRELVR